ncbi:variable surface lipoprotein [Metamycoplasma hyosynoviae]|uniref:variable surface lipoprotein n=1 Tax=Metamycoplasma hyosynoviae TaxID=29559 RepID=UPI00236711B6|nr:variable surface lipoprotein [Metamycoplasma hyosynoviae]MDD7897238.1 variable surface lipoprotein [Metamycoplasma hyosynoviae]
MKKSFKWILSSMSLSAFSLPLIATSCPKKVNEQDTLNTFANNYASNVALVNQNIEQNKAMDKSAYNMPGLETGYEIIDWKTETVGDDKVKVSFKIKNSAGKTSNLITKEFPVKKNSTNPGGGSQQGGGNGQGEQPENKKIEIIDEGEQDVQLKAGWQLENLSVDLTKIIITIDKADWPKEINVNKKKNTKTVFYSFKEHKIHGKTKKGQKPWDGAVLMSVSSPFDLCAEDKPLQDKQNKQGGYNTSAYLNVIENNDHYLIKFRFYDFKAKKISKHIYAIKIAK